MSAGMRNYTGYRQSIARWIKAPQVREGRRQKLKLRFTQSKPGMESHLHSWWTAVHCQGLSAIRVALKELNSGNINPVEIQSQLRPGNASSEEVGMFLGQSRDSRATGQGA